MKYKSAIFKIGGKILEDFESLTITISQLESLYKQGRIHKIILVPGGGTIANFIRIVYDKLMFTEELAHWMGIIAMNYNGIELGKKFPKLLIIDNLKRIIESDKIFCIFLPYQYLKANDNLPHSWEVTSDSISLYLANEIGLNACFLIKNVDGIFNDKNQLIKEVSAAEFQRLKDTEKLAKMGIISVDLKNQSRPIDPYLITLIKKNRIPCVILNGTSKMNRIIDFFDESKSQQEKIYTIIK
ncbi:MAG: hypothetical protein ACFFBI_04925 [Promethearchaeota archaeon]